MHGGAAGLLVVSINILSHDDQVRFLFKINQSVVGRVGLTFGNELPAPVVPAPDQFGVGHEGPVGG